MCKKFGSTALKQLYGTDGFADSVTFDFHFAARTAGDPTTDHDFQCPDEQRGCPYTKHAACFFNASAAQSVRVPFMLCWEAADETTTPQQRTKTCAAQAGVSSEEVQSVLSCAEADMGTQLLVGAAQYFMGRFPEWSKVTGPFNVPHIFVGDEDQYGSIDYSSLLAELCAAGAKSSNCSTVV